MKERECKTGNRMSSFISGSGVEKARLASIDDVYSRGVRDGGSGRVKGPQCE